MSIYRRDEVLPEWEPVPWGMAGDEADRQEQGFRRRAQMPIHWQAIPYRDLPAEGWFGQDKDWLAAAEAFAFATANGENMLLIDHAWSGFPDPPRWGLMTRPGGQEQLPWQHWGHFADLPNAWSVPAGGS